MCIFKAQENRRNNYLHEEEYTDFRITICLISIIRESFKNWQYSILSEIKSLYLKKCIVYKKISVFAFSYLAPTMRLLRFARNDFIHDKKETEDLSLPFPHYKIISYLLKFSAKNPNMDLYSSILFGSFPNPCPSSYFTR